MAKIFLSFLFSFTVLFTTSQTADFTFQTADGLLCTSSTINFTQTSSGNPVAFVWDFGNRLKNFTANPSITYASPGNYTVKLIAIYPNGAVETTKVITINPDIKPRIVADRVYICQPGAINFTTTTNGSIAGFDWDFGDSTGIATTPTNINSHNFADNGSYKVLVKATDASGCYGYDSINVEVKKLPITGTVTPTSGCIPAVASFRATPTLPLNDAVANYTWDFGDGSAPAATVTGSISNSYNVVGNYTPKVTITTVEGCVNEFNYPTVAFGTPPTNHISYPEKTIVCGSETSSFISTATDANRYYFSFGDGILTNVADTIVQHKYTTLGTKRIYSVPVFNGCAGTSLSYVIDVIGVIAGFSNANTCIDRKTFSFTNTSQGIQSSVLWSFGDGSVTENSENAIHTFPVNGAFPTSLRVVDSITGCVDSVSRTIYTASPTIINPDTEICRNLNTAFAISETYENTAATYSWNTVGKQVSTGTDSVLDVKADILGNFTNNYVVINNGSAAQYCPDTLRLDHPILVRGPDLDFSLPTTSCFTDTLNITNNSKPFIPSDSVILWHWNYGSPNSADTTYQPEPLVFTAARSFNIKLSAVDINGCTDSLIKRTTVNPLPFLTVLPHVDTLCLGQADTLLAFHSNDILWSPSAGLSCTTCDTVLVSPTVTTSYIATAVTPFNCSIQDTVLVKVIPPFTAVPPIPNPFLCLNEEVTLDMEPKDKIIVWSPTNGLSNTNIYNPVARPSETTTYTATLSDSTGCFTRTAEITVTIKSLPRVDAGPDRTVPYNSGFTIAPEYSGNVRSYLWSPAEFLNCTTCPRPNGNALSSQMYTIRVVSDSGCIASDSVFIAVECKDANILMPKAYTPNNDNLNDYYYPITRGIKTILRFTVYNREGQIIYDARDFAPNDKSFAWNGYFKGSLQPARAYVYVIEALCDVGEKLVKSGSFVLLR